VTASETVEKHTIAVLVDNEPGVLARVIGLFSGRGYNIESLTVAEIDTANGLSRITIVTSGTPMIIEQIKNQLNRLVPIHRVHDLTAEGQPIERELALIRVKGQGDGLAESRRQAEKLGARTVVSTAESLIFEITDTTEKLNEFIGKMQPLGLVDVSRTGVVAIARGAGKF
jgi:acetolactate synthase-1/3 small subunit